jgi:hypothetical protein
MPLVVDIELVGETLHIDRYTQLSFIVALHSNVDVPNDDSGH